MTPEASARQSEIRWRPLLADSAAVVLSILLAFAVDAWWDERNERVREAGLLADLLSDFQASRPLLLQRLEGTQKQTRDNLLMRDLVAPTGDSGLVEVPDPLVLAVIGASTYEPVANALEAALASGDIELIQSDEIRGELANWRRILVDTSEDEHVVRAIVNEQVVPLLARDIELGPYFDRVLPWFMGQPEVDVSGYATVRRSSELAGALAVRHFYGDFAARGLADLLTSLDRLTELLQRQSRP